MPTCPHSESENLLQAWSITYSRDGSPPTPPISRRHAFRVKHYKRTEEAHFKGFPTLRLHPFCGEPVTLPHATRPCNSSSYMTYSLLEVLNWMGCKWGCVGTIVSWLVFALLVFVLLFLWTHPCILLIWSITKEKNKRSLHPLHRKNINLKSDPIHSLRIVQNKHKGPVSQTCFLFLTNQNPSQLNRVSQSHSDLWFTRMTSEREKWSSHSNLVFTQWRRCSTISSLSWA